MYNFKRLNHRIIFKNVSKKGARHFESTIDHVDEVKIETDLVVEVFSDIFGGVQ